jgi:hypothetical protein
VNRADFLFLLDEEPAFLFFLDEEPAFLFLLDEEPAFLFLLDEGPASLFFLDKGPASLFLLDEGPVFEDDRVLLRGLISDQSIIKSSGFVSFPLPFNTVLSILFSSTTCVVK